MDFRQELVAPEFDGPRGCRVCRGALGPGGQHAQPPGHPHQPSPAWETIGFTTHGRAVLATIPQWVEVPCDELDADELLAEDD